MAFTGSGGEPDDDFAPLSSEINMTPFIDVMLVLLIIFMVTAPMLAQGMKVELPTARSGSQLESQKPVSITIAADGTLQVQDAIVSLEHQVPMVRAAPSAGIGPLQIGAAKAAALGLVSGVLDALYAEGITTFALLTRIPPEAGGIGVRLKRDGLHDRGL